MPPIRPQDNDAKCLVELGNSVIEADVAYHLASPVDKIALYQPLQALHDEYTKAKLKLLAEGVICTDADVQKMKTIRQEMNQAADTQSVIHMILKLAAVLRGMPYV
jgi:hypothetical protein